MAPGAQEITGLILAGGRGERMDGADKGWLMHGSKPLIHHVVERFAPQVGHLLISANRNIERYAALGEVVEDIDAGGERFAGPLIGVLSGLHRAHTDWVAIVPCDAPYLPADLVAQLAVAAQARAAVSACARAGGRLQPVLALVRTNTADRLAHSIAAGERAMHRWLESLHAVTVDFADAAAFRSINTPVDLDGHTG